MVSDHGAPTPGLTSPAQSAPPVRQGQPATHRPRNSSSLEQLAGKVNRKVGNARRHGRPFNWFEQNVVTCFLQTGYKREPAKPANDSKPRSPASRFPAPEITQPSAKNMHSGVGVRQTAPLPLRTRPGDLELVRRSVTKAVSVKSCRRAAASRRHACAAGRHGAQPLRVGRTRRDAHPSGHLALLAPWRFPGR
jgi:hypothetical protein